MDGHGHLYASFDMGTALDSAAANFGRGRRELGLDEAIPAVILLADPAGGDPPVARFDDPAGAWRFRRVDEETVKALHENGREELFIVAGRQMRTAEGLEVLALATLERFPQGRDLRSTLRLVQGSDAVPVLPSGFGKWTGRRGSLVEAVVADWGGERLLLGENGGRWSGLPEPEILRRARRGGVPVLAGSDPLPLPGQERRVGAYGSLVVEGFDSGSPGPSIRRALLGLQGQPRVFGARESLIPFVLTQCGMQLRKVFGGDPR